MASKNSNIPAHGSNILREEIPKEYKWNIEDIYSTETEWSKACAELKAQIITLKSLRGTLTTATKLLEALKLQDKLAQIVDKIFAYARLQQDADNTDQHFQVLVGTAESLSAAFASANSFIEPEMLSLGEEKLQEFFLSEPALNEYKFYITNLTRISKHILSADKEELFAQSHLATCSASNAFRALVSADMEFPQVMNNKGELTSVSEGNYMLNISSTDRILRKNSFKTLLGTYRKFRNTLASTLTGSARTAFYYATVHKYESTLESCLAEDNIPVSLYDGLIAAVHENLAPLHEYIQLKKDVLGYEELHAYDLYVPLLDVEDNFSYTFPEACEVVTAALAPLGEEYIKTLKLGFNAKWIDAYENKGKRSGAYSWSVYGVHPYVLMNYQQRYSSISTIAHEMGHALHSYFSTKSQTFINSEYTIFSAEVASTTNENLLLEYILKSATDTQKIYLLNQFLENVRTTVYRQVQFAEFEKFIHDEINSGRSLQAEKLENYWLDSNRQYYGPALTTDTELANEWSRINHFYSPFYVYKYATGFSAATAFSSAILSGDSKAVEKYLGFLHAGGSDYSLNILKNAGVDLNTPLPVKVTLKKFSDKLQELKLLLGK